ncbi:26106_t:CDS:2, partial [Gigaspora margarita]
LILRKHMKAKMQENNTQEKKGDPEQKKSKIKEVPLSNMSSQEKM